MRYRKRPIEIDAVQITAELMRRHILGGEPLPFGLRTTQKCWSCKYQEVYDWTLPIETLEGTMKVSENDWVIKGVNGELYPCKPDIFEKTYEVVDD